MKVLVSRIMDGRQREQHQQEAQTRKSLIGSGDHSDRIRTYNFPQSRITDDRIGFTTHAIHDVMSGSLDFVIDPLIAHFRAEALKQQTQ